MPILDAAHRPLRINDKDGEGFLSTCVLSFRIVFPRFCRVWKKDIRRQPGCRAVNRLDSWLVFVAKLPESAPWPKLAAGTRDQLEAALRETGGN